MNLLELIERDVSLKKNANTRGGEYKGACPFCGGKDRFWVHPNYHTGEWKCRQCDRGGDLITYAMERYSLGFKQACEFVGVDVNTLPHRPQRVTSGNSVPSLGQYVALSDGGWQEGANEFCSECFEILWCSAGEKARAYLHRRGFNEDTIERAALGFNPEEKRLEWGATSVFMPRGIVIPWLIGGLIWKVNIRRASGEPKYLQAAGGANGLYNADRVTPADTIVLCEGEFDAMSVNQAVRGVTAVATGTTSGARVSRWLSLLSVAGVVLVGFDNDESGAGDKAAEWWLEHLGAKAIRLAPPAHDWNEALQLDSALMSVAVNVYALYCERESTELELEHRAQYRAEMLKHYERVIVI